MSDTIVQVCGCKNQSESSVDCFVKDSEAEFYGVYLGQPGAFNHHVDRDTKELALKEAEQLIVEGKASVLDDQTFN